MIEFDVRRTRDGELIAFHDAAAGGAPVSGLTRDDIAAAVGVRPPLLAEVLSACTGRIKLDVELKEDGYVPDVMAVLRAGFDPSQMVVTSFLPTVVGQAKQSFPEVKTGLLVGDGGSLTDLLGPAARAVPGRPRPAGPGRLPGAALPARRARRAAPCRGGGAAVPRCGRSTPLS